MNQLVFVEKEQVVTDSLTVAEVFQKEHRNVMRDIRAQIDKLIEADEENWMVLNFEQGTFEAKGTTYNKYNLTEEAFTLVAMAYTTPEAMKMKVKFIQEFKRMREHLAGPRVLTEKEQLMASMKLSLETAEEIATVKQDVEEIKKHIQTKMTIDHSEQLSIQNSVRKRVETIAPNYEMDKRKIYSQIHTHLRRAFVVPSYRDIKQKDFTESLNWIKAWRPLI